MLIYAILAAIVSATFWKLSANPDMKKIWAVVFLAVIAMLCFTVLAPLG